MKKLHKLLILLTVTILLSTSLMAQMTLKFITANANEDITLPLHGTVSVTVNWGDGNSNTYTSAANRTHTYSTAGTQNVSISVYNSANPALTQYGNVVTYSNVEKLTEVTSFGNLGITSFFGAFRGATNLTVVPTSLPTGVTDVRNMFYGATSFNGDISEWDVSDVTEMGAMFYGATIFNQDISGWDVSEVTDMGAMFREAKFFNQDIGGWERSGSSLSKVDNMNAMFHTAIRFNQDIGNWNVSAVTNMAWMFYNAAVFNQDIGNWDVTEVTSMAGMMGDAKKFNQDIGDWNISKVTDMTSMFYKAEAFNQDISTWERTTPTPASSLNEVLKMKNMFNGAKVFNQDIGNWDVSKVNDMMQMFIGATAFNQDLGDWDVSLVTDMTNMFNGVTLSNANYDALLIGWDGLTSLKDDVVFSAGSNVCTPGPAAVARQSIIDTYGWVFTDGGIDPLTWDGSTDSDWNDADNWDYTTLPISTYDVIIANVTPAPVIAPTGTASCNDLTINTGATLTIQSTSAGTGSLIVGGAATGDVTVERFVASAAWHLVSPSTTGINSGDFYINATDDSWLTEFSESTGDHGEWSYITSLTQDLDIGSGYSYWIDGASPANDNTVEFTGSLRTTDLVQTLAYTDANHGWNSLGNPFASAIDWDESTWSKTNTTGAVYVWSHSYVGYVASNGSGAGLLTDGIIPTGQGFFVRATTGGTFTIAEAARVHSTQAFYKSKEKDEASMYVRVDLDAGNLGNTVFIGFPENGTDEFDFAGDADKLFSSDEAIQMFATENDKDLCINANAPLTEENNTKTVPLHLVQVIDGSYTLSISQLDQLPDTKITLEDLKTGTIHNFNENTVYSFTASENDDAQRFLLHFGWSPDGIDEDAENASNINIYSYGNEIYIRSSEEAINQKANVFVYDMLGREILSTQIYGNQLEKIRVDVDNVYVVVKVVKDGFVETRNVFIK